MGWQVAFTNLWKKLMQQLHSRLSKRLLLLGDGQWWLVSYRCSRNELPIIRSIKPLPNLRSSKSSAIAECHVFVNWRNSLGREVKLPEMSQSEIELAIPYALASTTPLDSESVFFRIVNTYGTSGVDKRLMIEFSECNDIEGQLIEVSRCNIYPVSLHSHMQVWEQFLRSRSIQTTLHDSAPQVGVIILKGQYKIVLLNHDQPPPSGSITTTEEDSKGLGEEIANEIDRLLQVGTNTSSNQLAEIHVTGSLTHIDRVVYILDEHYRGRVSFIAPETAINVDKVDDALGKAGTYVSDFLRAFFAVGKQTISPILPMKRIRAPFMKSFLRYNIVRCSLLLTLLLVILIAAAEIRIHRYRLLESELTELIAKDSDGFDILSSKLSSVRQSSRSGLHDGITLDILHQFVENKPNDLWITGFTYRDDGRVVCYGNSATAESPVAFVKSLESSGEFSEVSITNISSHSEKKETSFIIRAKRD